jgi:hypothetical protein
MHTVELLERAIAEAQQRGFVVRQDWLSGSTAGACELKGRRWLLIDLALSPREQLDLVLEALRQFPRESPSASAPQLHSLLPSRKAA